jgi:hypothetical protein
MCGERQGANSTAKEPWPLGLRWRFVPMVCSGGVCWAARGTD